MTRDKLDEILEKHIKWLREDPAGERADMSYADMSETNMSGANMRYANMRYANMSRANMSGANMRYANMSGADMSGANMSGAGIDYTSFTLWCGSLGILIDDAITSQLLYHVLSCVEVSPDVSDEVKKVLLSPETVAIANQFRRVQSEELRKIATWQKGADK